MPLTLSVLAFLAFPVLAFPVLALGALALAGRRRP